LLHAAESCLLVIEGCHVQRCHAITFQHAKRTRRGAQNNTEQDTLIIWDELISQECRAACYVSADQDLSESFYCDDVLWQLPSLLHCCSLKVDSDLSEGFLKICTHLQVLPNLRVKPTAFAPRPADPPILPNFHQQHAHGLTVTYPLVI